ncbi:MAG: hypothetical protein OEM62_10510, partial [Acidobacteriota bacterium]|nr:hypothetical protein [Acidobacteriota bacterium]
LLSRLAEAVAGPKLGGDRSRLTRVLGGLSAYAPRAAEVDPQKIANRQKMVQAVRNEIQQLTSFEQLTERDLVGHYRHLKHGLGNLLFEESVLPVIVDTNLVLAGRIQDLTRQEERLILDDYEKVSRLEQEGGVDRELMESVNRLHLQVSHFRKQLDSGDIRLQDVAQIRQAVLEMLTQVEENGGGRPERGSETDEERRARRFALEEALPSRSERRLLAQRFEELVALLSDSTGEGSEGRQLDARAQSYRLEKREIAAFDRLAGASDCDEGLERFVLAGAALRQRINDEVNEIHAYRSRVGGREVTSAEGTTSILRLGDWYLRRFSHYLENDFLAGNAAEARQLQVLRMRLMRDYSGLWLVAHA